MIYTLVALTFVSLQVLIVVFPAILELFSASEGSNEFGILLHVSVALVFGIAMYLNLRGFLANKNKDIYAIGSNKAVKSRYPEYVCSLILLSSLLTIRAFRSIASQLTFHIVDAVLAAAFGLIIVRIILIMLQEQGIARDGILHGGRFLSWSKLTTHQFDRGQKRLVFAGEQDSVVFDYNPQDEQTIESIIRQYRDNQLAA